MIKGIVNLATTLLKYPLPDINYGEHMFLYGGAIRSSLLGEVPNDFGIFSTGDKNTIDNYIHFNFIINDDYEILKETNFIFKCRNKQGQQFDILKKQFDSVYDIMAESDFSVCSFAYNGRNLYSLEGALDDVYNKILRLNEDRPPRMSIPRYNKYTKKYGFTPVEPERFEAEILKCEKCQPKHFKHDPNIKTKIWT